MKKHIITKVSLRYVTGGLSEIPPVNAPEFINLDEDAHSVEDGYMTVDEIFMDGFTCTSTPDGSVADIDYTVCSTYEGPPEDFDKAMSDGWLVWDCEVAGDDLDGEVWTLSESRFENKVAEPDDKRVDLN